MARLNRWQLLRQLCSAAATAKPSTTTTTIRTSSTYTQNSTTATEEQPGPLLCRHADTSSQWRPGHREGNPPGQRTAICSVSGPTGKASWVYGTLTNATKVLRHPRLAAKQLRLATSTGAPADDQTSPAQPSEQASLLAKPVLVPAQRAG
ncbi:hypothetical protein PCASD_02467 [Puccinia coronata f. sp. avenae]|uniref:Uncharacterized protein n=1 Tax=Puccinia coronata f. sp. avenae TaxID=200324 RepID=A0A2N5VMC7_9BASI|nr:hypothetical protein PCASD_02467 [Puccinia coronata f. sp. avenae]